MLVLSRKKGQEIAIGDDIVITIVETRPGSVRLGIDAPRELPVVRTELFARRREQEQRRSDGAAD